MGDNTQLILASTSPRRRQLMALGGWQFRIQPTQVDESPFPGEAPVQYALRMAESKARAGAEGAGPDSLVIGSDTIVVDTEDPAPGIPGLNDQGSVHAAGGSDLPPARTLGDQPGTPGERMIILGKPTDYLEAARMLKRLRGRTHQVVTAIAVLRSADQRLLTDLIATDVTMRPYTDSELQAYVESGDPLDKAGAYAIQHSEFDPVERIRGCFANVVGLPVCILQRILGRLGISQPLEIPTAGDYESCPVCQRIIQEGLT